MTTRDFLQAVGQNPVILLVIFVLLPLLAFGCGRLHHRGLGGTSPWKYYYASLVYLTCIPGLFAGVLTAYALFFTHENLIDVNPLVYFLPIGSMIATLAIIGNQVAFAQLPGFRRLSGLMLLMAVSFAIVLAIEKTRIFIGFFGSFTHLLILAIVIFAVLRWSTNLLFRG